MAEFGSCHRNEPSGALHGIMRVRAFTQDDAHIFCTEEQIVKEVKDFCVFLHEVYHDFGFTDVEIKLSTRPEKRAGTDETWDKAEEGLADAIKLAGYEFEVMEGEGAFYGPKLEFQLTDAIKRKWQCGTIQLDFVLPERLNAQYVTPQGSKKNTVILHRAILGSFERFIGILIENYAGKLPLWVSPVNAVVCSISENYNNHAQKVAEELQSAGIITYLDDDADKISYKIRKHSTQKVPYIITIGKQEEEQNTLSIRILGSEKNHQFTIENFINFVYNKITNKDKTYE
jgi:threonyl-tRNA synthetase